MELRSRSLDGSLRADAELTSRLQAQRRVDLAQSLQLLVEPVDVLLHLDDAPAELAEWPKRPAPFLGHVRSRGGAPLPERAAQVARPENAYHRGDAQPSTDSSVEHAFLPILRCACSWSCSRRAATRGGASLSSFSAPRVHPIRRLCFGCGREAALFPIKARSTERPYRTWEATEEAL